MKVLTGIWKGRKLNTPSIYSIRPTINVIRSAIFDVLQNYINFSDSLFIDFFAGSGAVGIEACSREFKHVIFIDKNIHSFNLIKKNTAFIPDDLYSIYHSNSFFILKKYQKNSFDLFSSVVFFFDPPFNEINFKKLYSILYFYQHSYQNLFLVFQLPKKYVVPTLQNTSTLKTKNYGSNKLVFLEFN